MGNIEIKTTAQLLDEFCTNQIKCFMLQEQLMETSLSDKERAEIAIAIQRTNSRRTDLIRVLDDRFNSPGITNAEKSYRKNFENK